MSIRSIQIKAKSIPYIVISLWVRSITAFVTMGMTMDMTMSMENNESASAVS